MSCRKVIVLCGCAGLMAVAFGRGAKPAAEKAAASPPPRLVRLDLLPNAVPEIGIRRDIFVPFSGPAAAPERGRPGLGGRTTAAPAKNEAAAGEAPDSGPALRYVGYIQGKTGIVALVMFEGQALAVAVGETVGPAWKVVKVTGESLDIQGTDGKSRTFALEGERK